VTTRSSYILPALLLTTLASGCGDDETTGGGGGTGPATPTPIVDLAADTNRDGYVWPEDATEQAGEDQFSADSGASFLANIDDDDGDGVRDCDDAIVNVTANNTRDEWDLVRVLVTPWPDVPEGALGVLALDLESVPWVRVHRRQADGSWAQVLGDGVADHQLTAADIAAGVELGIEGRTLVGVGDAAAAGWDGLIELSLHVDAADGARILTEDNPDDGVDWVQLRVAPWQMFGNHHTYDTVYSSKSSAIFYYTIEDIVSGLGLSMVGIPGGGPSGWADQWTEDWFLTGFTAIPTADGNVHGMTVALPRPYSYGGLPLDWLEEHHFGIDQAVQQVYLQHGSGGTHDSGGNHELIPPYENGEASFPIGRIIYGHPPGVLDETEAFYTAQGVQGPALTADTNWLAVGHIDEVFTYVPADTDRGWKLLAAAPALCTQMMEQWQTDGHGATEMFIGKQASGGGAAAVSIDELLADTDFATWNQFAQAQMDDMVDQMVSEIGLTPDEIIELPFWFEDVGGMAMLAYHPGTINAMIHGDQYFSADPFGPLIDGADGFKTDLEARIATATHQLGSDGQGLTIHYIDDWDTYHILMGEVHCGTNQEGPPQLDAWWEVTP